MIQASAFGPGRRASGEPTDRDAVSALGSRQRRGVLRGSTVLPHGGAAPPRDARSGDAAPRARPPGPCGFAETRDREEVQESRAERTACQGGHARRPTSVPASALRSGEDATDPRPARRAARRPARHARSRWIGLVPRSRGRFAAAARPRRSLSCDRAAGRRLDAAPDRRRSCPSCVPGATPSHRPRWRADFQPAGVGRHASAAAQLNRLPAWPAGREGGLPPGRWSRSRPVAEPGQGAASASPAKQGAL